MSYFMTDADKASALLDALEGREREIHQYQVNIDNYTHILGVRTGDPEYLTWIEGLLKTERQQQAIAQQTYDALIKNLGGDAAVTALIAARSTTV